MRRVSVLGGVAVVAAAAVLAGAAQAAVVSCGPFTDVAPDAFCPFVLEIFYLGITTGTTPTTYDPTANVSRLQMAAFLSRTVDRALKRGSRRAALDQFWTPQAFLVTQAIGLTTVGITPNFVRSDGVDLWVSNSTSGTITRVRGSDGRVVESWNAADPEGVVVAMGRVFVAQYGAPGALLRIDPSQPAGSATTVATGLGAHPFGVAFDGGRIWTANDGGSVSIVTPGASIPWSVTTATAGFLRPTGPVFDGANMWVTDALAGTLLKLDGNGAILQTVTVGDGAQYPVFDGANIWVPRTNMVAVVRASTGALLATVTGGGITGGTEAAFDGERILVPDGNNDMVALYKAADLSLIGTFGLPDVSIARGACSDGVNFWIALHGRNQLGRF